MVILDDKLKQKEKYPEVTAIHVKITPEWIDNFDIFI